jgi:hypothetical protein
MAILKDVTRVHYQGPVQVYARRLWPFLRMSIGYITKVLYNSTRETIMTILKDATRVHYQCPVQLYARRL